MQYPGIASGMGRPFSFVKFTPFQLQNSKIFCQAIKEFLLKKEKQDKLIILVLDHASWHTSKKTTKFLEKHKNQIIHLIWVPAYCGDLNVKEYI